MYLSDYTGASELRLRDLRTVFGLETLATGELHLEIASVDGSLGEEGRASLRFGERDKLLESRWLVMRMVLDHIVVQHGPFGEIPILEALHRILPKLIENDRRFLFPGPVHDFLVLVAGETEYDSRELFIVGYVDHCLRPLSLKTVAITPWRSM